MSQVTAVDGQFDTHTRRCFRQTMIISTPQQHSPQLRQTVQAAADTGIG
jgi:hypothetical protein